MKMQVSKVSGLVCHQANETLKNQHSLKGEKNETISVAKWGRRALLVAALVTAGTVAYAAPPVYNGTPGTTTLGWYSFLDYFRFLW